MTTRFFKRCIKVPRVRQAKANSAALAKVQSLK